MAINSIDRAPIRFPPKLRSVHGNEELNTIYFSGNLTSQSSIASSRKPQSKSQYESPYLSNIQLLSRVTEKRILHKKTNGSRKTSTISSTMQKSNSDETKKNFGKKNKKSVLTLPNVPAPKRQDFIVSDTNESEYFDLENDALEMRQRPPLFKFKQKAIKGSSDIASCESSVVSPGRRKNKSNALVNKKTERQRDRGAPPEVWAAIRKMNKMRFRPSPVISEESIVTCKKKKKKGKRRNIKAEGSFIETFRTEEIAYISSVEYSSKTTTCCQSMSNDRVTVIDRNQELANLSEVFENQLVNICKGQEPNMRKNNRPAIKSHSVRRNHDKRLSESKALCRGDRPLAIKDKKVKKAALHEPTDKTSLHTVFVKNTLQNLNADSCVSSRYMDDQYCLEGIADAAAQTPQVVQHSVETNSRCRSPDRVHPDLRKKSYRPRLVTTMPSSNALTKNSAVIETRRKIQAYKYPLIVVAKDQIISNYEVVDLNFPHIKSMEENTWPFMIEWKDPKSTLKEPKLAIKETKVTSPSAKRSPSPQKLVNNIHSNKSPAKQMSLVQKPDRKNINKKNIVPNSPTSRKHNRGSMITEKELNQEIEVQKTRNLKEVTAEITNFTDKMLELLWKNNSTDADALENLCEEEGIKRRNLSASKTNRLDKNKIKKKDANIDTIIEFSLIPSRMLTEHVEAKLPSPVEKKQKQWSKLKKVNTVIDSVINKLQNGVYYEAGYRESNIKGYSEVSIQTLFTIKPEMELNDNFDLIQGQDTEKNEIDLWTNVPTIPGFDESISNMEIEAYNKNQITLKDCNTNVSICFDITVSVPHSKSKRHQISNSLIQYVPKSADTKVFKYNTTISNTDLPAMICSLLPKMVQNLATDSESPLLKRIDEFMTPLSTISEIVSPESVLLPRVPQMEKPTSPTLPMLPPPVRKLFYGSFSTGTRTVTSKSELVKLRKYEFVVKMLPKVNFDLLGEIPLNKTSHSLRLSITYESVGTVTDDPSYDVISACKAIQLYHDTEDKKNYYERTCVPVNPMLDSLRRARSQKLMHSVQYVPITITYDIFNNEIIVNMFGEDNTTTISVSIKHLIDDEIFSEYVRSCASSRSLPETEISDFRDDFEGREVALNKNTYFKRNKKTKLARFNSTANYGLKTNRKCSVKLYKRHKVASHFDNNVNYSTPLRKIHTMSDFLHVLGAGKTILSVFDGNTEQKILTSLAQMQDWVSHINSQQALLVLLLNNKKETPNLNQLRPMLLQGIAVNRITRANELDMEIEVIEREKIRVSHTAEGITYVPASVENCNQIYEELYWIAKTTASDYQKNFDDSSQRLLKSLLEKRKTLNPSYLRVMARYVGLGLLKSTKRH